MDGRETAVERISNNSLTPINSEENKIERRYTISFH
jgi:hypothetical protein